MGNSAESWNNFIKAPTGSSVSQAQLKICTDVCNQTFPPNSPNQEVRSKGVICRQGCARKHGTKADQKKVMEAAMGQQLGEQGLDAEMVEARKGASSSTGAPSTGLGTGAWIGIGLGVAAIGLITVLALRKK